MPTAMVAELKRRGHRVEVGDPWSKVGDGGVAGAVSVAVNRESARNAGLHGGTVRQRLIMQRYGLCIGGETLIFGAAAALEFARAGRIEA